MLSLRGGALALESCSPVHLGLSLHLANHVNFRHPSFFTGEVTTAVGHIHIDPITIIIIISQE